MLYLITVSLLLTVVLVHGYRVYTAYGLFLREAVLLRQLVDKRPDTVSKDEWEHMVGWTLTLHGHCNYGSLGFPHQTYRNYMNELESRLAKDKVEVEDIRWIWDSYLTINPQSASFFSRHLPTTDEARRSAVEGEFGLGVK